MSALLIAITLHCSLHPVMPRAENVIWRTGDITARIVEAGIELECD